MTQAIQLPMIHSNGTHPDVLLDQNMSALDAARKIIAELEQIAEHVSDNCAEAA